MLVIVNSKRCIHDTSFYDVSRLEHAVPSAGDLDAHSHLQPSLLTGAILERHWVEVNTVVSPHPRRNFYQHVIESRDLFSTAKPRKFPSKMCSIVIMLCS